MYASIARMLCTLGLTGLLLGATPASADPHQGRGHDRPPSGHAWDGRHHHNRYYPARGRVVYAPPAGYRIVKYRSVPYRYYAGSWYRPYGTRFIVAAPPVGLAVSVLPDFYTTVWFGGARYYCANDIYYVARPAGGYVVAEPPAGPPQRVDPAPSAASDDFFLYPRNGQSQEPQARGAARRNDYLLRAITACLEGSGCTVR